MPNPLVGSTVLVSITVTNPTTGELEDATDVDLVIRDPAGVETTVVPDHPSTGVYEYYLTLDQEGWWYPIWTVTMGSLVTVTECSVCAAATVLVGV